MKRVMNARGKMDMSRIADAMTEMQCSPASSAWLNNGAKLERCGRKGKKT
jgi:hypothetical protein